MSIYIDKIILYLTGAFLIYREISIPYDIIFLLFGVIVFGITCYLENSENYTVAKIVYVILPLAGFFYVRMIPFVPIILYSVAYTSFKQFRFTIPYSIFVSGLIVRFAFGLDWDYMSLIWLIGICILSVLLGYKTGIIINQDHAIKKIRDDTTEKNNYLTSLNKSLVANMDNEVKIATLSERNRIAREIHDNVGHMLSRSILQLGAIRTIHKSESIEKELEPLQETLNMAMNNIRESVHDLHKESFDVKDAASKILEDLKNFNVTFDCDFSKAADKEVKYAFLTILKEATTNIEKYSNGDKVKVAMRELEDYYQMLIEDNGNKHVNITHANAGIGISNMKERVQKLKGIITFSGENGFRIFISVPKQK